MKTISLNVRRNAVNLSVIVKRELVAGLVIEMTNTINRILKRLVICLRFYFFGRLPLKNFPQKNNTASSSNADNQAPPKKKSKIGSQTAKNSKSQQQQPSTALSASVAVVIPSTVHSKPQQLVVPQPIQSAVQDDKEGHLIYYNGQTIDSRCILLLLLFLTKEVFQLKL